MKPIKFKFAAMLMCILLCIGIMPVNAFAEGEEVIPDPPSGYDNGDNYSMAKKELSDAIDFKSYQLGSWVKTTFNDNGYEAYMTLGDGETEVSKESVVPSTEEKLWGNDLYTKYYADFVYDGNYVRLNYEIRNAGETVQTISIGGMADVQIAYSDSAPISVTDDGYGLVMTSADNKLALRFYGEKFNTGDAVDTFWYGYFGDRFDNIFVQGSTNPLTGVDSGISFSWKNRIVEPGETLKFSVIIGVGTVNLPSVVTVNGIFDADNNEKDMETGIQRDSYAELRVNVTDEDTEFSNISVYGSYDGEEPVKLENVELDENGDCIVPINTELSVGEHLYEIYAVDNNGNISNIATAEFNLYNCVEFQDWDGTVLSQVKVFEDEYTGVTAPENPEREGYTFTGWDKDFSLVSDNMVVTAEYNEIIPVGDNFNTTAMVIAVMASAAVLLFAGYMLIHSKNKEA